ncbi:hypothetical protein EDD22DRAFT_956979 [Suillus occidentalis]|nr:hypothetical protein EDD22DRAFT_956979 [Suillus occidentalis]
MTIFDVVKFIFKLSRACRSRRGHNVAALPIYGKMMTATTATPATYYLTSFSVPSSSRLCSTTSKMFNLDGTTGLISATQYLISLPRLENIHHLPVGRHLQQQGRRLSLTIHPHPTSHNSTRRGAIKYCGDLTAVQQAQVARWIFDNIKEARETVAIMLACNKRSTLEADPGYPGDGTTDAQEEFILNAAWTTLLEQTGRSTDVIHTDVDLECLSVFEQRLFEKSAQSGSAGNYQWGLDAGLPS